METGLTKIFVLHFYKYTKKMPDPIPAVPGTQCCLEAVRIQKEYYALGKPIDRNTVKS